MKLTPLHTVVAIVSLLTLSCDDKGKPTSERGAGSAPAKTETASPPKSPAKPVDMALIGAPSSSSEGEGSGKATSLKPPVRGFVWSDGKDEKIGYRAGIGPDAPGEVFDFDAKKQASELHGKGLMKPPSDDTPVPAEMEFSGVNSISTDSGGTLMLYGSYRNLILDFSALKKPGQYFVLGIENSPRGDTLTVIGANIEGVREVFVSSTDLVYPEQSRTIQADGPFALLSFTMNKRGKLIPPQSLLVVLRNGAEVTRVSLPATGDPIIGLKRVARSSDVISWHIEDGSGKVLGSSSFGLPVRGAVPDLVKYSVRVDEHLARPKR